MRVLALAVILCVSPALPAAEPQLDDLYTVFVELRQPYASNRATLQKMLKAEGYDPFPEGEREISLVLTAEQIGKLFQARVRLRRAEASATPSAISQPSLEGARIPGRFGTLMRRVYFDPQRS